MPCRNCTGRSKCREICAKLEAKLPKLKETLIHGRRGSTEALNEIVWRQGRTRIVLHMRSCLKGQEREALDLMYNRSLTLEETADAMHTSGERVRKILRRAFVRMSRVLARRNGERRNHDGMPSG